MTSLKIVWHPFSKDQDTFVYVQYVFLQCLHHPEEIPNLPYVHQCIKSWEFIYKQPVTKKILDETEFIETTQLLDVLKVLVTESDPSSPPSVLQVLHERFSDQPHVTEFVESIAQEHGKEKLEYLRKNMPTTIEDAPHYLFKKLKSLHYKVISDKVAESVTKEECAKHMSVYTDLFLNSAKMSPSYLAVQSAPSPEALSQKKIATLHHSTNIHELRNSFTKAGVIPTGIAELDQQLGGGFPTGKLSVICAASGHRKTTLAHIITANTSKNVPTLFWSFEHSPTDVTMSLSQALLKREIPYPSFLNFFDKNIECIKDALIHHPHLIALNPSWLADNNITYDQDLKTLLQVVEICEPVPKILIIDYLQCISDIRKADFKRKPTDDVLEALKKLAEEKNIAIVLLSQFDRMPSFNSHVGMWERIEGGYSLDNIPDSMLVRQIADCIVTLYDPTVALLSWQPSTFQGIGKKPKKKYKKYNGFGNQDVDQDEDITLHCTMRYKIASYLFQGLISVRVLKTRLREISPYSQWFTIKDYSIERIDPVLNNKVIESLENCCNREELKNIQKKAWAIDKLSDDETEQAAAIRSFRSDVILMLRKIRKRS